MAEVEESTFLFADLAGFTALTEAHGDEDAADLAEEFATAAAPLMRRHGAELIKTIGDELMIRVPSAAGAVELGLCLSSDAFGDHGYPGVRVGMHHGPAVRRGNDWYGATVNIAARIAGLASAGEVLVSDSVRRRADGLADIAFTHLGPRQLRNVSSPVDVYVAHRVGRVTAASVVDPVCRMVLDPQVVTHRVEYRGVEYSFCSAECATRFRAAPQDYPLSG